MSVARRFNAEGWFSRNWCLLVVSVVSVACGASGPAPAVAPVRVQPQSVSAPARPEPRLIANQAEAVARVDEVFPVVLDALQGDPRLAVAQRWAETLPATSRVASRGACSELGARFTDTMGPGAHAEVLLFGDLGALAVGDCWIIWISQGFQTLAVALDAESSALRFVWNVPEG
jgi:hypothetical protein